MAARVFISYRREDTGEAARALFEHLSRTLGEGRVFIDLEAIAPGVEFAEEIVRALEGARVVLAVIGPRWEEVALADGTRRLDDPADYVRLELATALERAERVIPVLVGRSSIPIESDLPAPLARLPRLNGVFLEGLEPGRLDVVARAVVEALGEGHRELAARSNVPVTVGELVGRDGPRAEIADTVSDPPVRLLTLTGPGGTGKTSLALQVAEDLSERYPDGTFFVPLAEVAEPDQVPSLVAGLLGVREQPDVPLASALSRLLATRHLLLILDNLEHLRGVGPVVDRLVGPRPQADVIATSRTALRIAGERVLDVPPLAVPEDRPGPDEIASAPAVQLFLERARAAGSLQAPSDEELRAVGEIAVRLDGLPLAIELAAARVRALPPVALLGRLEDRLAILTSREATGGERQRTLEATIAWSHDLLDPETQVLFGRLAAFVGGFTLSAVEAVCADGSAHHVLDAIDELVDHSLIRGLDAGSDPRYGMLETIRAFAAERLLEDPERERALERHATFYATWAADLEESGVGSGDETAYLWAMARERANCISALEWSQEHDRADLILRLASGVWRFAVTRGLPPRFFEICRRRVEAREVDPLVWADGTLGVSEMARYRGDLEDALALKEMILAALRTSPALDPLVEPLLPPLLTDLGEVELALGHLGSARRYLEAGLERELLDGSPGRVAHAQQPLGELLLVEGDAVAAATMLRQAYEGFETDGWRTYATGTLVPLAEALFAIGEDDDALRSLEMALERLRDDPAVLDVAGALHLLAARVKGSDPAAAVTLWSACEQLLDDAQLRLAPRHGGGLERCREHLSGEDFDAAWNRGRMGSLDAAIELGLQEIVTTRGGDR